MLGSNENKASKTDWQSIYNEADDAGRKAADTAKVLNPFCDGTVAINFYPATLCMKNLKSEFSYFLWNELESKYCKFSEAIVLYCTYAQNMERNEAYAKAFCQVLNNYKVKSLINPELNDDEADD